MIYVLDTNIVLNYIMGESLADHLIEQYLLFSEQNTTIISVVTVGELNSIALQRKWGNKKMNQLIDTVDNFLIVPINSKDILAKYAEIDAFSQGKLKNKPLPQFLSARNMGKNDLWIAATVSALQATLITTDKDFNHLNHHYLELIYVDIGKYYNL